MKKIQIKLSNKFDQKVDLSLEPEGTIVELSQGKSVLLEITGEENPVLDLQINKQDDHFYISIWPVRGKYEVNEET